MPVGPDWSNSATSSPIRLIGPPVSHNGRSLPTSNPQSPRRSPSVEADVPLSRSPVTPLPSPGQNAGQSNANVPNVLVRACASDGQSPGHSSGQEAVLSRLLQTSTLPQSPRSLDSGIGSRSGPEPSPLALAPLTPSSLTLTASPTPTSTQTPPPRPPSGQSNASSLSLCAAAGRVAVMTPQQHSLSLSPDVRVQSRVVRLEQHARRVQQSSSTGCSSESVSASRSPSRVTVLQVAAPGTKAEHVASEQLAGQILRASASPELSLRLPGAAVSPRFEDPGARDSPLAKISEGVRRVSDLSSWWYKPKMSRPNGEQCPLTA